MDYLARTQNPNGSWTCRVGYKLNDNYIGDDYDNVCVTALAGMAFMAQGSFPGRGKYADNVEKALDFTLACVRDTDGYITKYGTRMYEHAFATLFLSEVYGMSPREDIKRKLKKAAYLIVNSQNAEGGWRYQPAPIDADISVTVTTLQALRAARNVGISVPKETIDRAVQYVKKCAVPASQQQPVGGPYDRGVFNYQLPSSRRSFALTAAGVTALMSAGEYDLSEVQRGLKYMLTDMKLPYGDYHYFYAHYYASQSFFQAGGRYWQTYWPMIQLEIVPNQRADGSWIDDVGAPYATAMACIILQIPNDYLPIFQR
ncbi:MAG: terpene cyclase/mutase family protein [Planctomycetes bacterium]|nr:terpene cyclase/mutase family protein [Planctomycetota bacterium]